jgi:hypothetical protein
MLHEEFFGDIRQILVRERKTRTKMPFQAQEKNCTVHFTLLIETELERNQEINFTYIFPDI